MAVSTINAIGSSPEANSYVTAAEADQHFEDRLASTDWSGASSDDKAKALLEATRRVDSFRFFERKYRTSPEQALEFPRSNAKSATGSVSSSPAATSLVANDLAGLEQYPDDYFIGWSIEFRDGALEFQIRRVTDFVSSTGALTFDAFGSAPSVGDQFRLIEEIPRLVKLAVYETAIWLLAGAESEGDVDPSIKQHSIGKFSETFVDGHGVEVRLPKKAVAYLRQYVSHIGTIE